MSRSGNSDINLLPLLEILISERSVTAAAQRVGITQSAMSHSLKRLRELLHDPLLIKTAGGMEPTPRAMQLHGPIKSILAQLDDLISPDGGFDCFTSKRKFTILCNSYSSMILLPEIISKLELVAPDIQLETVCSDSSSDDDWLSHQYDLVLGHKELCSDKFTQQSLWHDELVTVCRTGHSLDKEGTISLPDYANTSHIALYDFYELEKEIDARLEQLSINRKVKIRSCHLDVILSTVSQTDMIATLPKRYIDQFGHLYQLKVLSTPVSLPSIDLKVSWESKFDFDGGQRWLRNLICDISFDMNKRLVN